MARYLALDALRPGDIVLSAVPTLTSLGIRIGTFSRVSHAALVLHPLLWFEALGSTGIGYKVIEPALVENDQAIRLGMPVPRGGAYYVKRFEPEPYAAADAVAKHAFARKLVEAASRFAFLNYAAAEKFLPMLRFKLGDTGVARFIANNVKRSGKELYPGPFCSWLVADCYRDVGLPLFDIESVRITPRALDHCPKLRTVAGTIIEAAPLQIPPRFKHIDQRIQIAVGFSRQNLATISQGASLAKGVTEMNAYFTALGLHGAQLFDSEALAQSARNLAPIDQQSRDDFADWQKQTQDALDVAYPNLESSVVPAASLTPCRDACLDETGGRLACSEMPGCRRATDGFLQTLEDLYTVFPRPAEL